MSSLKHQISSAFQSTGHPPLAAPLLSQIAALSTSLRLSPSKLVEAWEAHSLTKNVEELTDASLGGYRSALAKAAGADSATVGKKNVTVITGTGLGKRKPAPGVTPSPATKRSNVIATPATQATAATPAATPAANKATQQNNNNQRNGLSAVDSLPSLTTPYGKGAVSPASKQQPPGSASSSSTVVITPPTKRATPKYADRKNAGQLVTSYNPHNLPTAAEVLASKSAEERERLAPHRGVTVAPHPAASHPESAFRHMFTPLEKRAAALEERLNGMSDAICERYNIKSEDEEMVECMEGIKSENKGDFGTWTPVGLPKQNKVLCVGRICNEAHEGRINRTSIRLEGSRQHSAGSRIQLDLQTLHNTDPKLPQSYSFFPGQIVAVEGINSSGRKLQASRLLEGVSPPVETLSRKEMLEYQYGSENQDGNPLSIVSICGPFTTKDNLEYDPLVDALMKIAEDKPDVVVMCGPFVDGRQPLVAGGEPTITDEDGNERKVSYEYLFANKISLLLEELYVNDPELKTQFVLVPSMDDAFLDAVYPQPPMENQQAGVKVPKKVDGQFDNLGLGYVELAGRENVAKDSEPQRIHCVSNPCTLRINDVTVGITSTDVLFHISSDECNANLPPGTRLTRIAQHLVQQRSYYPLFPAAKGASLDLGRSKEWEMPVQPDILIAPSKLASFARKVLDATIVVNPGELTKNTTGGTYAVVDVHPMKREVLDKGIVKKEGESNAKNDAMEKGVQDRIRVDIKRI
eukprot:CAMPEP_0183723324 /NCGR_PEP_ID=MMETSP0737-20130205/14933_1 /TAXON_ID=385413 /ORGANISM="Thalassiosira miniscula, Strain CCMP1093" /LENGTH=749 /DNA_ID=CAMNT_0025953585 /DNA_START=59 /DNA_END=2308 /DNA_ORIENTATION=-